MSNLINVADDVYEKLTKIKKRENASYSTVLRRILLSKKEKTKTWADIFEHVKKLEKKFKGPKEHTDIDKLVYGVSREGN